MEWQPIQTAPKNKAIDIFIKSQENPIFGRRATNVCIVEGKWYGDKLPEDRFGEYVSHWMPLPKAPE